MRTDCSVHLGPFTPPGRKAIRCRPEELFVLVSFRGILVDEVCNTGPGAVTPWLVPGKKRFDCNVTFCSASGTGVRGILENGRRGVEGGCVTLGMPCSAGFIPFNSCLVVFGGRACSLPGLKRLPCGVGGGGIELWGPIAAI